MPTSSVEERARDMATDCVAECMKYTGTPVVSTVARYLNTAAVEALREVPCQADLDRGECIDTAQDDPLIVDCPRCAAIRKRT